MPRENENLNSLPAVPPQSDSGVSQTTVSAREPVVAATVSSGPPDSPGPSSHVHLPSPSELPEADVVVYDGQCIFCIGQVSRLRRWDGGDRLSFISLHDEYVKQRCSDLTHEQLMKEIYVLCADGRRFAGAGAARYLSRTLPRLWLLAPLLHVPFSLPLWQRIYLIIAKRRYKISGKKDDLCQTDACEIHLGGK